MDKTITSYLSSSKIDYLSHFGQAWIGFNSWYNENSDSPNEWLRIKTASNSSPMKSYFINALDELDVVDTFITEEVESLSKCKCENYEYKLDTSGFRFRLKCTNKNIFTAFLKESGRLQILKKRSYGLLFFNETNQQDILFKRIYSKYSQNMATPEQMVNEYNALNITKELSSVGIHHYGNMLHHDLTQNTGSSIYSLNNVFGQNYGNLCNQLTKITSIKKAKEDNLEDQYRCKGFDIFERYLYLLYSLRCSYFHGDIDPNNEIAQSCAQSALSGLRDLMKLIK